MTDFNKDLYRLKIYYNTLVQLLDLHFSGYFITRSDEVNRFYLLICIKIEEILANPDFKMLSGANWQPFDNLMSIDPDYPEGNWELGGQQMCGDFQSEIEILFIKNGEKTYELDYDDQQTLKTVTAFLNEYKNKKNKEPQVMENLIDNSKPYFQKNDENTIADDISMDIPVSRDNFQGIMRVFISHKFTKDDQKLALALQLVLRDKNIEGYMAESKREYELLIGEKIRQEIENSDYVVGIITKESEQSASVNQELGYAMARGIPIVIMVEKNVPHGVLTHGRDTEEFTRDKFEKHCTNVVEYILEKGPRKKNPPNFEWLRENVYTPLYNKMVKIHSEPDEFRSTVSNPWQELEPIAKLKIEPDIKRLFEEYSAELEKWKILLSSLQHGFTINQHRLGEIVKTAFEQVSLINAGNHIILDEGSSQEPRYWIDAFKFIMFDDFITNDEILYKKLLGFAMETNNGHHRRLQNWKTQTPVLFTHIFNVLPELRKELRVDFTDKQFLDQRNRLNNVVEKIVNVLETKLIS